MTFTIKNDLLYSDTSTVEHHRTRKKSGRLRSLRFIVIHYTAGLSYEGDLRTLTTSDRAASAHIVLGQDGKVGQIEDFRTNLWHAGKSKWGNLTMLNQYSVGIEVVCPGWVNFVREQNGVKYFEQYGRTFSDQDYRFVRGPHPNGGPPMWWMQFSDAQMEALEGICAALKRQYRTIERVLGHDDISPGRKIDPGLCMPRSFFDVLNGRGGITPVDFDGSAEIDFGQDGVEDSEPATEEPYFDYRIATPKGLNLRDQPDMMGGIIQLVPDGVQVSVISHHGDWWKIETEDGKIGYAVSRFLQKR